MQDISGIDNMALAQTNESRVVARHMLVEYRDDIGQSRKYHHIDAVAEMDVRIVTVALEVDHHRKVYTNKLVTRIEVYQIIVHNMFVV